MKIPLDWIEIIILFWLLYFNHQIMTHSEHDRSLVIDRNWKNYRKNDLRRIDRKGEQTVCHWRHYHWSIRQPLYKIHFYMFIKGFNYTLGGIRITNDRIIRNIYVLYNTTLHVIPWGGKILLNEVQFLSTVVFQFSHDTLAQYSHYLSN